MDLNGVFLMIIMIELSLGIIFYLIGQANATNAILESRKVLVEIYSEERKRNISETIKDGLGLGKEIIKQWKKKRGEE